MPDFTVDKKVICVCYQGIECIWKNTAQKNILVDV